MSNIFPRSLASKTQNKFALRLLACFSPKYQYTCLNIYQYVVITIK